MIDLQLFKVEGHWLPTLYALGQSWLYTSIPSQRHVGTFLCFWLTRGFKNYESDGL